MDWLVDLNDGGYALWVNAYGPSEAVEFAVIIWLVELERHGPPSVIGHSGRGHTLTRGPHGEQIEFSVIPLPLDAPQEPPWGRIVIHSIVG